MKSPCCWAFSALALVTACADGGKDDGPSSPATVAADHHLFAFKTLPAFGSFPLTSSDLVTLRGSFAMDAQAQYHLVQAGNNTATDRYNLETTGELTIYVTSTSLLGFRGAYGRNGTLGHCFFTDRVSAGSSMAIGLYYGMQKQVGQVELAGDWHVVSLHGIVNGALSSPENVGRGVTGEVTIASGDPGTLRTITGTGQQGGATGPVAVTFGGSIQNVLGSNSQGDGTCNFTLSYQLGSSTAESRFLSAAANQNMVLAVDALDNASDTAAGCVWLVRQFDAVASPAQAAQVVGTYYCGGHTLFVNPSNSGADSFVGTITLGTGGSFRWDGLSHTGVDFFYTGTYVLDANGSMAITIDQNSEVWFCAVDRDYHTLVFCDAVIGSQSSPPPELNLGFAVRQKSD